MDLCMPMQANEREREGKSLTRRSSQLNDGWSDVTYYVVVHTTLVVDRDKGLIREDVVTGSDDQMMNQREATII